MWCNEAHRVGEHPFAMRTFITIPLQNEEFSSFGVILSYASMTSEIPIRQRLLNDLWQQQEMTFYLYLILCVESMTFKLENLLCLSTCDLTCFH